MLLQAVPPCLLPPAPSSPKGLEQVGMPLDSLECWEKDQQQQGWKVVAPPAPLSASASLIHPGSRESDTGKVTGTPGSGRDWMGLHTTEKLPLKTSAGEARGREKLFQLPCDVDIRTTSTFKKWKNRGKEGVVPEKDEAEKSCLVPRAPATLPLGTSRGNKSESPDRNRLTASDGTK
ncbi:CD164 sialomucin-like 2 protein isoform X3 [Myiozetetes cayanensis]|uniref:CD164 sialomucin-like 2 protein isoform X3 n=1 Tax=Myiozetetes cayanensis TaxID=478635 RepID=UPI002160ACAA|nr:CD164 sialomucin-like 2 protein isoform X3 [Myiozetetes cayanensis]